MCVLFDGVFGHALCVCVLFVGVCVLCLSMFVVVCAFCLLVRCAMFVLVRVLFIGVRVNALCLLMCPVCRSMRSVR